MRKGGGDKKGRKGGGKKKGRKTAQAEPITYAADADKPARKGDPNFVLFLIDDMGWNAMGFIGNREIDTPRTDAMARSGGIFTNACASAPNCAPTRACLMSGQYQPRHGVYTVVDDRHTPGLPHHKILAAQSNPELGFDLFKDPKDYGFEAARKWEGSEG